MGRVGAPTRCVRRVCPSLSPGTPASTNPPRVNPLSLTMASELKKSEASGVKTLARSRVHARPGGRRVAALTLAARVLACS